jgi:hypothetical protein
MEMDRWEEESLDIESRDVIDLSHTTMHLYRMSKTLIKNSDNFVPSISARPQAFIGLSRFSDVFLQYCPDIRRLIEMSIRQSVFTQNTGTQRQSTTEWLAWAIPVESHPTLESGIRGFFSSENWENDTTGEYGSS